MSIGRPNPLLSPRNGDHYQSRPPQPQMRPQEFETAPFWSLLFWASFFCFLMAISPQVNAQSLHDLPGWDLRTGFDTAAIESPGDMHEPEWSSWIATQMKLDPRESCEVRTRSNKRVDILSRTEAIEVDWAPKWYEGVGQALFYAVETGREPALILLVREGDERDAREVLLCQAVCARVGVRLYVQVVPPRKGNETTCVPTGGIDLHGAGLRSLLAMAT